MSFKEISESNLLYVCVIIAVILVTLACVYYMVICYRQGLKSGVTKSKLNAVIKSSCLFAIVPSIAVVSGLVTLAAVIGLPYAWLRLSVIGSVGYELMAANMALSALQLDLASADGYAFGLIMWAMSLAMTASVFVNVIFVRKIHLGALKLGGGDRKWKAISQTVFMTALVMVLVIPLLGGGVVSMLTFLTSAVIAIVINTIAEKWLPWLGNFTLTVSLIGAMASAVLWTKLF